MDVSAFLFGHITCVCLLFGWLAIKIILLAPTVYCLKRKNAHLILSEAQFLSSFEVRAPRERQKNSTRKQNF